jgi:hypothetical protein
VAGREGGEDARADEPRGQIQLQQTKVDHVIESNRWATCRQPYKICTMHDLTNKHSLTTSLCRPPSFGGGSRGGERGGERDQTWRTNSLACTPNGGDCTLAGERRDAPRH